MQYTVDELRHELFSNVYDAYAIFKNFFGEEKTDLQNVPSDTNIVNSVYSCTDIGEIDPDIPFELSESDLITIKSRYRDTTLNILVWWPEVTVTNEHDRSVTIYDLYAKVELRADGTIPAENRGFQLNKATYTGKQFASGYQHSHTPSRSYRDPSEPVAKWQNPCLGSGPILSTITTLKADYDEMTWMLFCEELALYVTVESLEGVPYIRLESIGGTKQDYEFRDFMENEYKRLHETIHIEKYGSFRNIIKEFVLFYLHNGNLSLNYCDDSFTPGMPFYDYIIDLSNSFIAWVNKYCTQEQLNDFMQHKVLYSRIIKNGTFMLPATASEAEIQRYNGMRMLIFKGQEITLNIIPDTLDDENPITTLINPWIAMFILQNILRIINYRFTNGHTTNTAEHSNTAEASAPTYQTVIYL